MIIVHTAMGIPICTLLMRNFFTAVPTALREAAVVDGANELQVLTRIALPVSLPAIAVLATLQFTWIWNDFLWPLIVTQSDDVRTIMLGLVLAACVAFWVSCSCMVWLLSVARVG